MLTSPQDEPPRPAGTPAPDAARPATPATPDTLSAAADTLEVVRTHLVRPLDALPPARALPDPAARMVRRAPCGVAEYRALYREVGAAWRWHDRDAWPDARLAAWLARPEVAVWVLERDGVPGGYYELAPAEGEGAGAPGEAVELVYFGLVPALHGRGLGAAMLEHALHAARATGAARMVLHTCTLDGAAALPNYRARGFHPVREERYTVPRVPG